MDVVDLISAIYLKRNIAIDLFIVDYARYVESVDKEWFFAQDQTKCNMTQCAYIRREYVMTRKDFQETYDLKENKAIALCQMLDQLHVVKYHLIDIGMRYKADADGGDADGEIEHKDVDFDRALFAMKNSMTDKRTAFRVMRGSDGDNVLSKFVTDTATNDDNADDDDEKGTAPSTKPMASYSFGFRFFYWEFFKENKEAMVQVPLRGLTERGNFDIDQNYKLCDFFVAPAFLSIKHEALNATGTPLDIREYDGTMQTAMLKYRALNREMAGADCQWRTLYGVKGGAFISLDHIMAVLLYTDHDAFSAAFTRSFRKLFASESVHSVKRRHSCFANWAKALREAVECWGTPMHDAVDYAPELYHGLSTQFLFDGFRQPFRGPTSTSLQFEVAVTFANQGTNQNGIVIAIQNNRVANSFFNCIRWSRFSAESEMLFIGGFQAMLICRLSVIGTALRFDRWIRALAILSSVFKGQPVSEKVTRTDAETVHLLVAHALNGDCKLLANEPAIPVYVEKLLLNQLNSVTTISFALSRFIKGVQHVHVGRGLRIPSFGFNAISDVFLTDTGEIKWRVLRRLVPNVEAIGIQRTEGIANEPNRCKYIRSIRVDEEMLKSMLGAIRIGTAWEKIIIFKPSNSAASLSKLIGAHAASFEEEEFFIQTETVEHHKCGSCFIFTVGKAHTFC